MGGSKKKPKAQKPAPLVPATVSGEADYQAQPTQNTGRRAQSILDPMQAQDDENKDILG